MRLKLFRASCMADAIAQVRAELGTDALILNSRNVAGIIEITAAVEPQPEQVDADPGRIANLIWHGVPLNLQAALAKGNLEAAVSHAFNFGTLPLKSHEVPVMLTGPPGAGKTLTAVRLATRLMLSGTVPMVITTDGKRAGATEQLAAFTRLLGLPLLVASQPLSLGRALAQRRDGAPVLIDTAGADPREQLQGEELRNLAATVSAHVALVLPAGLDPSEAAELAIAHGELGAGSLIITRLDLARRMGGVVAAAAAGGLPLVEAGIGPGAVDGMIPFTPAILAARVSRTHGEHNDI